MYYKKTTFPEDGDIVICTVKKILPHSVFVSLDEYEKLEGVIHISEVSPGRIRNLRDFVKEDKRLVCKVLRVNKEKGHIDLSLRRVPTSIMRKKNEEYKQEQKAEKILEIIAQKLNVDLKKVYEDFGFKIIEDFGLLNKFFQDVVNNKINLKDVKIPQKYLKVLEETIKERIKPVTVKINKTLILSSYAPNGIELIKEALKKALDNSKKSGLLLSFHYLGAPNYRATLISSDYKTGEKCIDESLEAAIRFIKDNKGFGEIKK